MARAIAAVLAVSGALLLAFGWWGMETVAGRRRYDEMAGMIPEFAGMLGVLLLVAAAVLALIAVAERRRGARSVR
jgi:hypothetical protein